MSAFIPSFLLTGTCQRLIVAGEDGLTSEGGVARDTADSTTGEDGLTSEMGVMRDKEDSSDVTRVSLGRSCVVS